MKIKLSTIKFTENNPRSISKDKFNKLKQSIQKFPEMMKIRPLVIDENNNLLGGNMRLSAILELGMSEVPAEWVKKVTNLSDKQKKEFIIKDNNSFGEWDWDILANEWEIDELKDWAVEVPEINQPLPEELTKQLEENPFTFKITLGEKRKYNQLKSELTELISKYDNTHLTVSGGQL